MAGARGRPHRGGMTPSTERTPAAVAPVDLATLVFVAALWGGAYLFSRVAAPEVGPLWVGVARVGLAAAILLALTGRPTLRLIARRPREFVVVGLTSSAIPFTLIAFSALTLPTALGGLLNATTPMFTALIAAGWLGQRAGGRTLAGLVVGFGAVVVLLGWSPVELTPATVIAGVASLGAAANFAIAGIYARRRMPDVPPLQLAAGQMTVATAALLPLAIASGVPSMPSAGAAGSLLAIGVASTAIAWPLYFRVLRRTTATAASAVTFIIPGFAILWGALALGEAIGPGTAVGFVLVMVSLLLIMGPALPDAARRRARLRTPAAAATSA